MDFRYTVQDERHGEFQLDHCGALMDVEPMGEEYVVGMCHEIEDPTFDATAIASHPKAQVRPIHRPPRVPADRQPHCAWTVIIDDSHAEVAGIPALEVNEGSEAARVTLAPVDRADAGLADYSGPLLSDLDFAQFSRSALIRMADEVCLQMGLLTNAFALALDARLDPADAIDIRRKQFTGSAGIAAYRLARALDLPRDESGALQLLALHPALNPSAYVDADADEEAVVVRRSPAHHDPSWISLCGPDWVEPFRAAVRVLDAHLDVTATRVDDDTWRLAVMRQDHAAPEAEEVALARFSTGTDFSFESRLSLPITPV
jgi:hypothetical protein